MIKGKQIEKKESKDFSRKVGMFTGKLVSVNPTKEELGVLLDTQLEKDYDYLGKDKDSYDKAVISAWLKDTQSGELFNCRFYLVNKERESQANPGNFQYINSVGMCSWAKSEDELQEWFVKDRTIRKALVGEEELHEFMRAWLSKLDFADGGTNLMLDTKKFFKGDFKELKDAIKSFKDEIVLSMATVRSVEKDGVPVDYQTVYNRKFLPGSFMSYFNGQAKGKSKMYENFVKAVTDTQHGAKDHYSLETLHTYAGNAPKTKAAIIQDESDY